MTAHMRTSRLGRRARVWVLGVLSFALVAVWAVPARAVTFGQPTLSLTGAVAPGDVFVADSLAGTDCIPDGIDHGCGAVFRVDPATGQRTLVSDFGDPSEGPLGRGISAVAFDAGGLLVLDRGFGAGGTFFHGALFRVDPTTGARTIVTDFGDAAQGPTGGLFDVTVDSFGRILVGTRQGLLLVDATHGTRTLLNDFTDGTQGWVPYNPNGVAVEASGRILVADGGGPFDPDPPGVLLTVDPDSGQRVVLSDFADPAQGVLPEITHGFAPTDVRPASGGQIWVLDSANNKHVQFGSGALWRVDGTTGARTIVSDFTTSEQGPLGESLRAVDVTAAGDVLIVDDDGGTDFRGALIRVDPATGHRVYESDFGDPAQGPLGREPAGFAIAPGQPLPPLARATLTVTKAGTGSGVATSDPPGITCGADCSESYTQGFTVTLTATPDAGSRFTGWSGDAGCADGVVTMTADQQCTATFEANRAPTADAGRPYSVPEGGSVGLSGSGTDPEGDALSFAWDLDGDGSFETAGEDVTFSAAGLDGPVSVSPRLRVCDALGACDVATASVSVENVAPAVDAGPATAAVNEDTLFIGHGSFTDPGPDSWTATVDYGDGGGVQPLALTGKTFALGHSYAEPGIYTLVVQVTDDDGDSGSATIQVTVRDTTPPSIACAAADGVWHGDNVTIACTATDAGSGLADGADASFSLSTSVPAGVETADAATGTHDVCDRAGNCVTAGPRVGNKVDRKPPTISLTAPASGAEYRQNSSVAAAYTCSDAASGVASCSGPVASGQPFDTASTGSKSFAVQASDAVGNIATATNRYTVSGDSDGDGLLDSWEKDGLTVNGQFLNLPAMGADPLHKDIFVETDYMVGTHNRQPNPGAIAIIEQSFANAPVSNPDGKTGISLHVDYGPGAPIGLGSPTTFGNLSRADALPDQPILGTDDASGNYNWGEFDQIKNAHFDAVRRPVFHYVVSADNLPPIPNGSVAGRSRGIPTSDFILSFGAWADGIGTIDEQAATFMHELGHNLGLHHGGGDDINNKPNYLSVMNYSFSSRGLIEGGTQGHFDYSRSKLPDLNENSLDEGAGIGTNLGTVYYSGGSCAAGVVVLDGSSVDWNCDGDAIDTGLAVDINKDPFFGLTTLSGHNDWPNLVFMGGAIGGALGAPITLPSATPIDEITTQEDAKIPGVATDTTAPTISCGSADGSWHADNVTIACTATDPSGLAHAPDASFTLSTTVAPGEETANAQTGTRQVCDTKNNCATAGPIGGNKVDRKAPTLKLPANLTVNATSPAGASVSFSVSATDGTDASPSVSCSPASGSIFAIGSTQVGCTATDHVGNKTSGSFTVTVKRASQQIVDLINKLRGYLGKPALSDPLVAYLNSAADALAQNHPQVACNALNTFINAVKANKNLTSAQKTDLIADATRIRTVIGC